MAQFPAALWRLSCTQENNIFARSLMSNLLLQTQNPESRLHEAAEGLSQAKTSQPLQKRLQQQETSGIPYFQTLSVYSCIFLVRGFLLICLCLHTQSAFLKVYFFRDNKQQQSGLHCK